MISSHDQNTITTCGWWDSNPQVLRHTPLKRACLPISPHPQKTGCKDIEIPVYAGPEQILKNSFNSFNSLGDIPYLCAKIDPREY